MAKAMKKATRTVVTKPRKKRNAAAGARKSRQRNNRTY